MFASISSGIRLCVNVHDTFATTGSSGVEAADGDSLSRVSDHSQIVSLATLVNMQVPKRVDLAPKCH